MSNSNSEMIFSAILSMLRPSRAWLESAGGGIDTSTRLLEAGLIDSKDLLDIILEVEKRYGVQFNPEQIDFEAGITLGSLVNAFAPVGP